MLIVQITDSHLVGPGEMAYYGQVDVNLMLEKTVNLLNALDPRPEVVIHTGDLTDNGKPEEYAEFARIMRRLEIPFYAMIGNHDKRETMLDSLDYPHLAGLEPFIQYTVEEYPLRLIMLDSVSPDNTRCEFPAERLQWLQERLAEQPDRPTIVSIHHPPFNTAGEFLDADGPGWASDLIETLSRYPNIERILCGHDHRSVQTLVGGRMASMAPGTAHRLRLRLNDEPDPNTGGIYEMQPAGFQLHRWKDGQLVTHTEPVDRFRQADPITPAMKVPMLAYPEVSTQA